MKAPSTKLSHELARRQLLAFAGAGLVSACGGGSALGVQEMATVLPGDEKSSTSLWMAWARIT